MRLAGVVPGGSAAAAAALLYYTKAKYKMIHRFNLFVILMRCNKDIFNFVCIML